MVRNPGPFEPSTLSGLESPNSGGRVRASLSALGWKIKHLAGTWSFLVASQPQHPRTRTRARCTGETSTTVLSGLGVHTCVFLPSGCVDCVQSAGRFRRRVRVLVANDDRVRLGLRRPDLRRLGLRAREFDVADVEVVVRGASEASESPYPNNHVPSILERYWVNSTLSCDDAYKQSRHARQNRAQGNGALWRQILL